MDQESAVPFSAVPEFIRTQAERGKYKPNTAQGLSAACAVVSQRLEPGKDTVGYVLNHLDELIRQHGNLNRNVGQATLAAYRSRVRRAIEDYVGHRTDPQWQPASREPRKQGAVGRRPTTGPSVVSAPPASPSSVTTGSPPLRHYLPLRANFAVEILLPWDFTRAEAERVTGWVNAMAAPAAEKE